jgi:5-(carboxyamino)imidazole ribonucleotide synthase
MKVGIVGAGQLGRMLGLAGIPLGITCEFVGDARDAPAAVAGHVRVGNPLQVLRALARDVDVVTTEFENVPVEAMRDAAAVCPVHPNPAAIAASQDRLAEKELFTLFGIPTAPYCAIDSEADLEPAAEALDWPIVLKSRRLGYDGRGQRLVESHDDLSRAYDEIGRVPAIAEAFIRFTREVSMISVRGRDGEIVFYPLCENTHSGGILETTIAPLDAPDLERQAQRWAVRILEHFDYVGVLTIELFDSGRGLIANEMAPRVHNSGHWTIEGAATSQFENHLRAVAGLPLGQTSPRGYSAMRNLIGKLPNVRSVLAVPDAHLHNYGKAPRAGRKLGHCTIVAETRGEAIRRLDRLQRSIVL